MRREENRKADQRNHYHYYVKGNPNTIDHNPYHLSAELSMYFVQLARNSTMRGSRVSYKKAQVEKSQKRENERLKSKINSYEVLCLLGVVFFEPQKIRGV